LPAPARSTSTRLSAPDPPQFHQDSRRRQIGALAGGPEAVSGGMTLKIRFIEAPSAKRNP